MDQQAVVCDLGLTAYEPMWDLQKKVQSRIIDAKRNGGHDIPHVIFAVEHPPVYTLGKRGDAANLLADEKQLLEMGASFVMIDRGGDITFHGPGQLVVYPILDLDRIFTDIGKYLRTLEEAVIDTCAYFEIMGKRVRGDTGVWVGPDDRGGERKICAMGIKCSRWVTMHGLALNIATDLSFFDSIVPCGIRDRGVTSIQTEYGRAVDRDDVKSRLVESIAKEFELKTRVLGPSESAEFLDSLVGFDLSDVATEHSIR